MHPNNVLLALAKHRRKHREIELWDALTIELSLCDKVTAEEKQGSKCELWNALPIELGMVCQRHS